MEDLSVVLKDFGTSLQQLVKSEMSLARAELKDKGSKLARHVGIAAGFALFALLGILPFIAFLVIGLGDLMNGNYVLSSFLVSLLFMGVGGAFAYRFYLKLKQEDLSLTRTQQTLEEDAAILSEEVQGMFTPKQGRAA